MKQIIKSNIKRDLLKFLWIPIILIILSSIIIFQFKKDEQNSKHSLYFGTKNDVSEYFERRSIEIFKGVWSKLDFTDKNLDILVSMFTRNTRSIFTELEFSQFYFNQVIDNLKKNLGTNLEDYKSTERKFFGIISYSSNNLKVIKNCFLEAQIETNKYLETNISYVSEKIKKELIMLYKDTDKMISSLQLSKQNPNLTSIYKFNNELLLLKAYKLPIRVQDELKSTKIEIFHTGTFKRFFDDSEIRKNRLSFKNNFFELKIVPLPGPIIPFFIYYIICSLFWIFIFIFSIYYKNKNSY